jgi:hypothetical protein
MQANNHQRLKIERKAIKILGDTSRVITILHLPTDRHRISRIIQRIISMSETAAKNLITQIMIDFSGRHEDIEYIFERHLNEVKGYLPRDAMLSEVNLHPRSGWPQEAPQRGAATLGKPQRGYYDLFKF